MSIITIDDDRWSCFDPLLHNYAFCPDCATYCATLLFVRMTRSYSMNVVKHLHFFRGLFSKWSGTYLPSPLMHVSSFSADYVACLRIQLPELRSFIKQRFFDNCIFLWNGRIHFLNCIVSTDLHSCMNKYVRNEHSDNIGGIQNLVSSGDHACSCFTETYARGSIHWSCERVPTALRRHNEFDSNQNSTMWFVYLRLRRFEQCLAVKVNCFLSCLLCVLVLTQWHRCCWSVVVFVVWWFVFEFWYTVSICEVHRSFSFNATLWTDCRHCNLIWKDMYMSLLKRIQSHLSKAFVAYLRTSALNLTFIGR